MNEQPSSTKPEKLQTPKGPRLYRSALLNLAGAAIPALLLLATVPIYLHLIGESRYGVLAIVWLMLGYFGVFDLGLGRAVANRIAILHNATTEERQVVIWTGLAISIMAGIFGGMVLYLLGDWLFAHVLNIHGTLRIEAENAMPWLASALPLAIIISLLAGALEGRQAFVALNGAQIFGTVLYQIFPLIMAYAGWITLPYLIASAIMGRLLSAFLLFSLTYRHIPLSLPPAFSLKQVKPLLRYGGWITITGLVGPLLTVFDRFLIGAQIGMTAVTAYTVPYNLVMRVTILPASLQTALFPRFAIEDANEAKSLAGRAIIAMGALMAPIIVIALLLTHPFLTLWIGAGLAEKAAPVAQILLVGIWINVLAGIPYTYLQSRGRPDLPAKFHVLELLPYIFILFIFIDLLGIAGAAWAWDLRVLADTLLLFWAAKTNSGLPRTLTSLLPIIGAFAIAFEMSYDSMLYTCLGTILTGASIGWSMVSFSLEQRTAIKRFFLSRTSSFNTRLPHKKHGI